jgi:hypothetical protein
VLIVPVTTNGQKINVNYASNSKHEIETRISGLLLANSVFRQAKEKEVS